MHSMEHSYAKQKLIQRRLTIISKTGLWNRQIVKYKMLRFMQE